MSRLATLFLVALIAQIASAQTVISNISGLVLDETHSVVTGASVRLVLVNTGVVRQTLSTGEGFSFSGLEAGDYELAVASAGFPEVSVEVNVPTGVRLRLDFMLSANGGSRVSRAAETQGTFFTEREVRSLPNLTRDVFRYSGLTGNASGAGLGTRGTGFAFNGQREASTSILFDGVDSKDEFAARLHLTVIGFALVKANPVPAGVSNDLGPISRGRRHSPARLPHGSSFLRRSIA